MKFLHNDLRPKPALIASARRAPPQPHTHPLPPPRRLLNEDDGSRGGGGDGGGGGGGGPAAAATAYVSRRASVCGTVGVGKAFLMDLVVAGVPSPAVQRVQTACCMLDYHARAHFLRGAGGGRS